MIKAAVSGHEKVAHFCSNPMQNKLGDIYLLGAHVHPMASLNKKDQMLDDEKDCLRPVTGRLVNIGLEKQIF